VRLFMGEGFFRPTRKPEYAATDMEGKARGNRFRLVDAGSAGRGYWVGRRWWRGVDRPALAAGAVVHIGEVDFSAVGTHAEERMIRRRAACDADVHESAGLIFNEPSLPARAVVFVEEVDRHAVFTHAQELSLGRSATGDENVHVAVLLVFNEPSLAAGTIVGFVEIDVIAFGAGAEDFLSRRDASNDEDVRLGLCVEGNEEAGKRDGEKEWGVAAQSYGAQSWGREIG